MSNNQIIENAEKLIRDGPVEAPEWANTLILVVKSLIEEVKALSKSMVVLGKLQDKVSVQEVVMNVLKEENNRLNTRVENLAFQVDNNEQHGRNRNLVLRGIAEEKGEDSTDKFIGALNSNLPITLSRSDIERSHRLGRFNPSNGKPRPIIARFFDETKKISLYRAKKGLKGKRITLSENLTSSRQRLYNMAINILGVRKVWTNQGRIFTKHDGEFIEIMNESSIPQTESLGNTSPTLFGDKK